MNQQTSTVLLWLASAFTAIMLCGLSLVLIVAFLLKKGVKLETIALCAKAWCFIMIGFFTPLTVGLAQWANSGEFPGPIIWIVMGASCIVGAASQLLSFLSESYSGYMSGRKNGSGAPASTDTQQFLKPPETKTP